MINNKTFYVIETDRHNLSLKKRFMKQFGPLLYIQVTKGWSITLQIEKIHLYVMLNRAYKKKLTENA